MSQFAFLLLSGLGWLGVVAVAPGLGLEAQWVSLLRGAYLGMFSIALIVELRRGDKAQEPARATQVWLYSIPILSIAFYEVFGSAEPVNWRTASVFGCYFVALMATLRIRERMGRMRQGWWELLPPVLMLCAIVAGPYLWPAFVVLLIAMVGLDLSRREKVNGSSLDAVIMQLPSFCLAPVVLVLARDALALSPDVSRPVLEIMGLVVNGAGGALWTAIAMRAPGQLSRLAIVLWVAGAFGAAAALLAALFMPVQLLQIIILLGVLELLRGAVWLLTTHFLTYMTRWRGALVNLCATLLPLAGALAMRTTHSDGVGVLIYTLTITPLFLLLLAETRRRRGYTTQPSIDA